MCKVSVLMPVYNAEKYLAQAIDSIILQIFTDWELIIINDGSTDRSEEIIRQFDDKRIKYFENEKNIGLIDSLNKGITLCQGEYIARMDADDISCPNRLEQQVRFLDLHQEHILIGSNALIINENGRKIGKILNPKSDSLLQISLLFTNPFVHPSLMIRRNILQKNNFDKNWIHIEDYELWTRLSTIGKLANLDSPFFKYRWHESNVSKEYADIQNRHKNDILKNQLKRLNIDASDKEIEIHRSTFNLYTLGEKSEHTIINFDEISNWFGKLIKQNSLIEKYNPTDFASYLWSRWMVLCWSQKRYSMILYPRFISVSIPVLYKTVKLAFYLSRK